MGDDVVAFRMAQVGAEEVQVVCMVQAVLAVA